MKQDLVLRADSNDKLNMELFYAEDGKPIDPRNLTRKQKETICTLYYSANRLIETIAKELLKKTKGS